MELKKGDISANAKEYTRFSELLELRRRLRYVGYDSLDLKYLDLLRAEVQGSIDEIARKYPKKDDDGLL